ncbi:GTP-binding protein Obg [Desulfocucumis palustris]|uniref:GTPase Obg n=1 Tax=Desulfocucumis palustris TaxID=1898651 RepID=A0A2L2XF46_9FIRM|nr:GTPase ObgE [Desulfocucumis palustris]GBF34868.1 GTP-binding protein Obg [Desulfocucumis palustris]
MFYDKAKIFVKAGDGGNGCVAFRREKYVPDGGPWGGDGGRGGSVVLIADEGLRTLVDFRYHSHYKAGRGQHGMGKNMHGRSGEDLRLRVPVGTLVRDADTGRKIADLVQNGQEAVVAGGGRGGRGNVRFVTLNNKAPKMAEKGEPGEECWLQLELKLLADVGLVGFPNAGKSTIISRVSAARPKIADYPFTTLVPNLGVVRIDGDRSFVMADIPGLIEGAHAGAGLGHEFLRHTERTRILVHVLDMAGTEGRDPLQDFEIINREIKLYDPRLAARPMVVAANKTDLPEARANLERLERELAGKFEIYPVSAITGQGLDKLLFRLADMLEQIPPDTGEEVEEEPEVLHQAAPRFTIQRDGGAFMVEGREIERHLAMTDVQNEEAMERLQRIMAVMGIDNALRRAGAREGDTVRIKNYEFEFVE